MSLSPDLSHAVWRKSSHSSAQGQCVEVAAVPGAVAARDSKDPGGPALLFAPQEWAPFVQGLVAGEFGG
ncbi:DUF397 domain-containing protein [Streptomyces sp. LaBMicrA B280]|uniref:DUF397 domain-containing protein n=1 Tax=Streptomyces sp. LaBMicrA B280 TaxID=3391001 RepID=UPI003BA784F6